MKVKGSLRTAAKALRGQAIEGDDRDLAAVQYLMSRAAAAVRPVVVDDALEFLRDGKKVLIFTGFVEDVGEIRRQIVSRLRRGTVDEDHKRPIVIGDIWVGSTHGEQHGPDDREALIAYNQRGEASLLNGTGDSIGESFNIENTDYVLFAQLPITLASASSARSASGPPAPTRAAATIYYIGENTTRPGWWIFCSQGRTFRRWGWSGRRMTSQRCYVGRWPNEPSRCASTSRPSWQVAT